MIKINRQTTLFVTAAMVLQRAQASMAAASSSTAFIQSNLLESTGRRLHRHLATFATRYESRNLNSQGVGFGTKSSRGRRTLSQMTWNKSSGRDAKMARAGLEALPFLSSTLAGIFSNVAVAMAETLPRDAPEMGARLDAPAAASFGAVVVAFAFLQARIREAIKARAARRAFEVIVKDKQNQRMAGMATDEELLEAEERMSQLVREEQEARMVSILGIPFNLVIPDGGGQDNLARNSAVGRITPGGRGGAARNGAKVGVREVMKQEAEDDMRDRQAREGEMGPAATLKVAALWLVLISQLWLLVVLWNDPMGPATSTLLQD